MEKADFNQDYAIIGQNGFMNQLFGLWRDTWWLWCLLAGAVVFVSAMVSWVMLFMMLVLPFQFCYFAFIRYDENGVLKPRGRG